MPADGIGGVNAVQPRRLSVVDREDVGGCRRPRTAVAVWGLARIFTSLERRVWGPVQQLQQLDSAKNAGPLVSNSQEARFSMELRVRTAERKSQ